jgi:DNA-binding winged helix-turn-helix (wHTH) protein/Tfp pilus assembly protein PilF
MDHSPLPPAVVRFGVFEADLTAGKLRRNGVRVRLQDLPFRALALLLSRPGEVVTREDFRRELWPPDVFVDFEQGINSAMMRLRDALADSADNPIFIETIERRGYRWIAPLHAPETAPGHPLPQTSKIDTPTPPPPVHSPWRKPLYAAFSLLAIVVAAGLLYRDHRNAAHAVPAADVQRHAANPQAENFYLKGRFYWNKRTPESLNAALDNFNQAIASDPNYSDAYVGLADCYNLLREFSAMPANEAYFKAFAAARKAVDLDPQSSSAHASLAFVTYWGMWDAADAEKEFRRAIALDPRNANAHHWFATFLHGLGRSPEAVAEIDAARRLDPNSSAILADQGELLLYSGHREEAVQSLQQLEASDPDFLSPHRYLRSAYFDMGDYPHYIDELKKEANLTHSQVLAVEADAAAKGFAAGGEHGLFLAELAAQKKLYEQGSLSPYYVAQTEARLGEKSDTLRLLSICLQSHDELLLNLTLDRHFSGLYHDAEFQQFLAKIGLPSPVS